MNKRRANILVLFFVVIIAFGYVKINLTSAQTSVAERRQILEADLARLEQEIAVQQKILDSKKQETQSLERDVAILNAEIKKSQLAIQARNLSINRLSSDIVGKQGTIESLGAELVREKSSLAQILRKRYQTDSLSLVEMVLGNSNLSDFFEDYDSFSAIEKELQTSFGEIEVAKNATQGQKVSLEKKREEERELKSIQELEKRKIELKEAEKKELLRITKGVETAYQAVLRDKEKSAAQIRTELFTLRGSSAIPFEKALEYANFASKQTGVRPAFILGVIAEESNLGANVGTGTWTVDMHPTRDRPVFEVITRTLGLDPNQMPVSKKPWYGWGGAMGPAQFIPSTWVMYGGYVKNSSGEWEYSASKDVIRKLLGNDKPSNPWDPQTAFMASAYLLKDNGAAKGTRSAEILAALRYFAGWANASKPAYAFYGDEVIGLADKYQGLIDILNRD